MKERDGMVKSLVNFRVSSPLPDCETKKKLIVLMSFFVVSKTKVHLASHMQKLSPR